MRAERYTREGKYYGTEVHLYDDDDRVVSTIVVWGAPGDQTPTAHALYPYTPDTWRRNGEIDGIPIRDCDIIDYSHYQTEADLAAANTIADALNRQYVLDGVYHSVV